MTQFHQRELIDDINSCEEECVLQFHNQEYAESVILNTFGSVPDKDVEAEGKDLMVSMYEEWNDSANH
jgi:hypothetical protein